MFIQKFFADLSRELIVRDRKTSQKYYASGNRGKYTFKKISKFYADLFLQVYVYFSKRTTLLRTFQVKESRERLKNWYVDYIYVFRGLKIQKV